MRSALACLLFALVLLPVQAQTPDQARSGLWTARAVQGLNLRLAQAWTRDPQLRLGLRLDRALAAAEAALQFDPQNSDAWLAKGRVCKSLARWREANLCFEKALMINRFYTSTPVQASLELVKGRLQVRDYEGLRGLWTVQTKAVYSPELLLSFAEGLYNGGDRETPVDILSQAVRLYPDEPRLLLPQLRSPDNFPALGPRLVKHRRETGGFSDLILDRWLAILPPGSPELKASLELLKKAGYTSPLLQARGVLAGVSFPEAPVSAPSRPLPFEVLAGLTRAQATLPGTPMPGDSLALADLDSDGDGRIDGFVSLQQDSLQWLVDVDQDGVIDYKLTFAGRKPQALEHRRGDTVTTLVYEDYPWVDSLTVREGLLERRFVFPVYEVSQPVFDPIPEEGPLWLLPWSLSARVKPLPISLRQSSALTQSTRDKYHEPVNLEGLFSQASLLEERRSGLLVRKWRFYKGQAFLLEEDSNLDGQRDTWAFFRSGTLASVWRDPEQQGSARILEQFASGVRQGLTADLDGNRRTDFAQVESDRRLQLWDWNQDGAPEVALFQFPTSSELKILSFTGNSVPPELFPQWENDPWP